MYLNSYLNKTGFQGKKWQTDDGALQVHAQGHTAGMCLSQDFKLMPVWLQSPQAHHTLW